MILITGVNGHLGSEIINFLRKSNSDASIAGLVRSEEKARSLEKRGVEIRIGDYRDANSIKKAMKGIKILLLISSSTIENRVGQHKNVINAAKEEGVKQIFYTSMLRADKLLSPLNADHYETEKILINSGIPYTIHRHTFYTGFFPVILGNALETGEWVFPGNGKTLNFAFRTDMAEALARNLIEPENHQKKVYEITSLKAYTFKEYAEMISRFSGKELTYIDLPIEDFTERLKKAGMPDDVIALNTIVAETIAGGALDFTSDDLENLLGRKPKETSVFLENFCNYER